MSRKEDLTISAEVPVYNRRDTGGDKDLCATGEPRLLIGSTAGGYLCIDGDADFMNAMDQYKRDNRRQFPTWSEVLEVLHAMGYRKVAEPTPGLRTNMARKTNAETWILGFSTDQPSKV